MSLNAAKTVSGVFDKASLKLISAATKTSKKIEIWFVANFRDMTHVLSKGTEQSAGIHYSESRERPIQTIMKVSSKPLNYLPIFFSNSTVDRKVDS